MNTGPDWLHQVSLSCESGSLSSVLDRGFHNNEGIACGEANRF